jgi:hypothetical protein
LQNATAAAEAGSGKKLSKKIIKLKNAPGAGGSCCAGDFPLY